MKILSTCILSLCLNSIFFISKACFLSSDLMMKVTTFNIVNLSYNIQRISRLHIKYDSTWHTIQTARDNPSNVGKADRISTGMQLKGIYLDNIFSLKCVENLIFKYNAIQWQNLILKYKWFIKVCLYLPLKYTITIHKIQNIHHNTVVNIPTLI